MSEGFFAHAKSILGDEDRTEFDFNHQFSNDELLELLERNPRVAMMCQWMAEQMFKDGIKHPQMQKLEDIHFLPKIQRGITFARLHGESLAVLLNESPDLSQISAKYFDFEIYHRLSGGNGFTIEEVYPKGHPLSGQPSIFKITIQTEKMKDRDEWKVPAERCIVIKNPMLGQRWGGTPSSKKIAHIAHLEELMIRLAGVFGMLRCESFLHAKNVPNEAAAVALETATDKVPVKLLNTGAGIDIEPKSFVATGSAEDFEKIITIMKKYMANAMNVSQSLMDGAAEGAGGSNTLSSSTTNTTISYSTIKSMQTHFKPYIEQILEKIGLQKNFEFIEPNPMVTDPKGNVNPNDGSRGKSESQSGSGSESQSGTSRKG